MSTKITLATLPQATAQEVFDQVAEHLLTQKEKSGHGSEDALSYQCRYRGTGKSGNPCKCAAGCLIGDDEYNPRFEGRSWNALANDRYVPDEHQTLIAWLQRIHDNADPAQWLSQLHSVAQYHEFSIKALEKFQ